MRFGDLIKTEDGSYTLKHLRHGECYHSHDGAGKEAQDLYIQSSGLNQRICNSVGTIRVLDVGLGLAYNALSTVAAWMQAESPCAMEMLSLEIEPELVKALASGEFPWSEGWRKDWRKWAKCLQQLPAENSRLQSHYKFGQKFWHCQLIHPLSSSQFNWLVIVGDARQATDLKLPNQAPWDYIWQDPFSPKTNPQMWSKEWFSLLRKECHADTQLMSYSVARTTKDALIAAGWSFTRITTTTRKKHWLKAQPFR
ncbi:MAG: hypothetical protein D6756_08695 [Cyanobacteria bacterium J083]|nr:MAG: hypothetical protein D6756_08695 [Cyanobacteria bacterium J083]